MRRFGTLHPPRQGIRNTVLHVVLGDSDYLEARHLNDRGGRSHGLVEVVPRDWPDARFSAGRGQRASVSASATPLG